MTTPTIFSNLVGSDGEGKSQKFMTSGAVFVNKSVTTIPLATAGAATAGFQRVRAGERIVGLQIKSDDLDTGTAITLDVGFSTDSGTSEDLDAFFDGIDILQDAGSVAWPLADQAAGGAEGVLIPSDGYLTYTFADSGSGGTTTAGDIHCVALVAYGEI